ncbi:ATP-binding protein [Burkholderia cepacia]|uniref:ATP-binding protein n=1 Tax=Burkholderia cepacia TaxID=292 RepID=UPI0027D23BC7|nr:ATP-binding protein [Burkholderia cepacia]
MDRIIAIGLIVVTMSTAGWANAQAQFTVEEKAWIAHHPIVRTRIDTDWRPFEFRERGKPSGLVPSYLDAVAQVSGLRFEYVDDVSWSNSPAALKSGKIDMVPDVSTTSDPLRFQDITFTQSYFVGTVVVVAPEHVDVVADFRSLAGRRVAIKEGGGLDFVIRRSGLPITLMRYQTEGDALAAVAEGDADVAVGPDMSILPLLRHQFKGRLYLSGSLPERPYSLAFATRSDSHVLASILDKSLAAIPAPAREEITRRWIESADYGKPTLRAFFYYHRWQATAACALVLALAAVAFVSARARAAAIRRDRDKAMFLAFISHEIRTPMHTILSSLELLQRSKLSSKQASRADAAVAASESLLTLVDDILDYSRLEARNVTLAPEPTPVMQWAQCSADMVRWRVEKKGLRLAVEFACPAQLCVLIDPMRTRQILLNLLVNAIKYTSEGTVTLRVDYVERQPHHSGTLVIEVCDTGIGIPADLQQQIFEPYQRVEQPGGRGASGSGLGLSICRELVALMGGDIDVVSSSDTGTAFTVTLPVRLATGVRDDGAAVHTLSHEPVACTTDDSRPTHYGCVVLVVDDHEAVRHAIRQQLDALACRCIAAADGAHALEQFERSAYDMVLLDCDLPDLDGYTVATRMRTIENIGNRLRTPIIAISASTDDAHHARCFDSGMDGVLAKPLRLDTLRQLIDLWCPASAVAMDGGTVLASADEPEHFGVVYRQTVDADLTELTDALSVGDTARAQRAAHRIKGAAAVAGHAETSEIAAALEHRLAAHPRTLPGDVSGLHEALRRRHLADCGAS